MTIPGVAELLGLTIAAEIGDIARFPTARKLVGYSGLTPEIKQSGQSSRIGRHLQGRPRHAALGRRRSRPTGLAAEQPLASRSTPTSSAATARPTPPRPPSPARS